MSLFKGTLAVKKIFNGNKYITTKYKYKYKYQVPHLWYLHDTQFQVTSYKSKFQVSIISHAASHNARRSAPHTPDAHATHCPSNARPPRRRRPVDGVAPTGLLIGTKVDDLG